MNHEVEAVARAFYAAEDDAREWDNEPEILKEEFRQYARAALALLTEHQESEMGVSGAAIFANAA
jgi:hypothetical protein